MHGEEDRKVGRGQSVRSRRPKKEFEFYFTCNGKSFEG